METASFFDPFRGRVIQNAPEEKIRQSIVRRMVCELGFPKAYLSIERALHEFVEQPQSVPKRRLDIVAFCKRQGKLVPLLVIECKAVPLQEKMLDQVFGYNHYVQAPFIALVNEHTTIFAHYNIEKNTYQISNGLCSYESLLKKIDTPT